MTPLLAFLIQAAVAASAPLNPNANLLFERDAALKQWAVSKFDSNRDGWLTLYEAQPAIREFREIADGDGDGRVTTAEYARAKEYIVARW